MLLTNWGLTYMVHLYHLYILFNETIACRCRFEKWECLQINKNNQNKNISSISRCIQEGCSRGFWHWHGCPWNRKGSCCHPITVQEVPEEEEWRKVLVSAEETSPDWHTREVWPDAACERISFYMDSRSEMELEQRHNLSTFGKLHYAIYWSTTVSKKSVTCIENFLAVTCSCVPTICKFHSHLNKWEQFCWVFQLSKCSNFHLCLVSLLFSLTITSIPLHILMIINQTEESKNILKKHASYIHSFVHSHEQMQNTLCTKCNKL